MSIFHFPFSILHLLGLAAVSLLCGLLLWLQLVAAWPSIEDKIDQFRRQPPFVKLLLMLFVGIFVVFGSTKTNLVDQTSGTNIVEIVEGGTNGIEIAESRPNDVDQVGLQNGEAAAQGGDLSQRGSGVLAACHEGRFRFSTSGEDAASPLTVTLDDIARGWQLWEVRTNSNVCYTMPEGATLASNWWVRGAYENVKPIDFGSWRFPFGTNEYDSLWAFSWGKARFALGDAETEIVAVGAPMSAVPYRSRLWSAADTNGARVVTWENFVLGRALKEDVDSLTSGETPLPLCSPLPLCCAQIELRSTGDFIVRSNEIEKVYHRIDDFDWDGDGILNWSDGDPYWYDGDYTGQVEWWREYVDETVGTGLENGYYKLTASFQQEGFRRTVLTVGWEEIVVAEPGEYVFLLEKGNEYEIWLEPFVAGVEFNAVDDIPAEEDLAIPLMSQAGHWEGRWTKDDGELYLTPPLLGEVGCIIWTPKLRVSPDGWNPSAGDPTETFTAMLFDRTDWMTEPTYAWTSIGNLVTFGSPSAETTRATCRTVMADVCAAYLDVSFGEHQLQSSLIFRHQDEDVDPSDRATCWMENLPDTLFVNNDNDLGGACPDCDRPDISDDDIPCACIRLASSVPTNGTIRIDNMEGFTGFPLTYVDDSSLRTRAVFTGSTWDVEDETYRSIPLFFNAAGKSDGFETSQIKIRWTPEAGPEQTCVRRFTVVEPVAEPICTATKRVSVNGEMRDRVYNPCGVVIGRDAYFKIDVKPDAYPDSMIAWETSGEGSVQFVGGSHGREVRLRGVAPGDVTLSAKLGNCVSPPPSFTFRVVTNRTIRLSAWIVENSNLGLVASTVERVREMVKVANDIYAQVGVTFDIGDRIVVTNIPAAYDINWEGNAAGRWSFQQLTDLHSTSDSVECYFVNGIFKVRANKSVRTIGGHGESGIVMSANGTAVTLAHELGHRLGMADVYWQTEDDVVLSGFACWSRCMEDWNGGCSGSGRAGARYYPSGTLQRDIVRSMLMDGMKDNTSYGVDITYGDVFGLDGQGQEGDCATGYFNR